MRASLRTPRAVWLSLLLLLAGLAGAARADDEAAAWQALRAGGSVALMRHADAPGIGDPPGFRVEDCATQRNLGPQGRSDAAAVGARLKAERVPIGRLLSSPWCRCLDTARLLDIGPVQPSPAFASSFRSDRDAELAEAARGVIRDWKGPGTLMVVTHAVNIQALTGFSPGSGDIIVVTATPDGALKEAGRLKLERR